ncbi:putative serine carboxypeptidase [Colletotrichum fructicola]|nr:putative serine carboxypeptidase [Colletotrichum fructicola]KAF4936694.1 putative serine carboxypeptidase [Colletotrichum fructicola]
MYWLSLFPLCATQVAGAFNEPALKVQNPGLDWTRESFVESSFEGDQTQSEQHRFLTEKTKGFTVDGKTLPNVHFDAGESYAGLLPVNSSVAKDDLQELYFWFFPSKEPPAEKEIIIWLTGGPGCSSIGELLQENGPISWKPGTFGPVQNPWSWHRLSNVVWIEQPVGTGFSQGPVTATDERDVARQFMGFWKAFVDTFDLHGYKVFVTGSSYSGLFSPYISSAMLDAEDTDYFNVKGMMIFDPSISQRSIGQQFGVTKTLEYWGPVFTLNHTARAKVNEIDQRCGYSEYMDKYMTFPPSGTQPVDVPRAWNPDNEYIPECDILSFVVEAERVANPCFSLYNVLQTCPLAYDPIGFTDNRLRHPSAGPVYFDREDVKAAINAPVDKEWRFCSREPVFVDDIDNSNNPGPGSLPVIPGIIERTKNVIIGHGLQDFILQSTGTLLGIQNMTWGGIQGFQVRPENTLNIPLHPDMEAFGGSGELGVWHSERGLTYFETPMSGHFVGRDAPFISFRALEVLLGRVEGFGSTAPFTRDYKVDARSEEL